MQQKTRYISVQIGIGGFQPYPASEVDRLGYGDCKGLTNYTKALLSIVGIESYYSVVQAGNFKVDFHPDFADMNQGNHVILCLPFENDTTWLECTSKFSPFGFLGDFTDDRLVVACTPEGGKIMRTTKYPTSESRQVRKAEFKIAENGSLSGKMTTIFEGAQFDNHHSLLNEAYSEQVKKLPELYPLPNLDVKSLQFEMEKKEKPATKEVLDFNSYNYCAIVDGKMHLYLNPINKIRPIREIRNRNNPVYINRGYYDEDVFNFELPEGYLFNVQPEKTTIEKPFGKYTTDLSVTGKIITYKRVMQLNEGYFKAEDYQDLVDFYQAIADADNAKLILSKI
ncbi:hypothetical protein [Pedobacter sp. SYSU D00535]|uniref:hypothetical protein n=1 Tax=Pedobacter sp. SYSU D00535 TaxID=2810308 RepID=UPI001F61152A|nr:hypothetical protein [Pedobacter sp. SYSU D00535]